MKKQILFIFCLVTALLLCACSEPAQDETIQEQNHAPAESISESEDPPEPEPEIIEDIIPEPVTITAGNLAFAIEYIPKKDERYAEYKKHAETIRRRYDYIDSYDLPNGYTLLNKYDSENPHLDVNIYLADSDGKQTLLLEGLYSTGESVRGYDVTHVLPDNRFIYCQNGWEGAWFCGLYDMNTFTDHPFDDAAQNPLVVADNFLYYISDTYPGTFDYIHLARTDLATFETEQLLADEISTDMLDRMVAYDISPNAKYFALSCYDWVINSQSTPSQVHIFSLEQDTLIFSYELKAYNANSAMLFISDYEAIIFDYSMALGKDSEPIIHITINPQDAD